jgi:gamma-glutamylaminecyclotransferase
MKVQVMVYGTLMRGERNHRQMTGARFVREARTSARFTLVDRGAFPALLQEGATSVRGELYEVTLEHLARLDWFEGVPRLYERRTIRLADGARAQGLRSRSSSR